MQIKMTILEKIYSYSEQTAKINQIDSLEQIQSLNYDTSKEIKVLRTHTGDSFNGLEEKNELISLPHKTILLHTNDNVLYDDDICEDEPLFRDKTILLVGAGHIKRTSVLDSLKKIKFKKKVNLVPAITWSKEYFDDFIFAEAENIEKKEETLSAIRKYMEKNNTKFDAILTYDEYCVLMSSYLTTELNLPGIPFDICNKIRNKYEFRRYSEELGINYPCYNIIKSLQRLRHIQQIEEFLSEIANNDSNDSKYDMLVHLTHVKPPFVVKNPFGSGKDFVYDCRTLEDYHKCLKLSLEFSDKSDLLIEEYIYGDEIDVDMLIANNKVIFANVSDNFAPEKSFFEKGGTTPSVLFNIDEINTIKSIVSKWMSKLRIMNACLHFEARCQPKLTDNDPLSRRLMPIEINMRLGGSETWSMIMCSYGVNFFCESIYIALGLDVNSEKIDKLMHKMNNPRYYCVSHDYHLCENVFLDSINVNFNKLLNESQLVELSIFRTAKENLKEKDYMGWITVKSHVNSSQDQLLALRNRIMNECLKIEYSAVN